VDLSDITPMLYGVDGKCKPFSHSSQILQLTILVVVDHLERRRLR